MNSTTIDSRLAGTPRTRFLLELFGNSAQFPIANMLLEILAEGPRRYLLTPDAYILVVAAIVQARFLSRSAHVPPVVRFLGNLIGPALYTLVEFPREGLAFFSGQHHLAYWIFAGSVGVLQAVRPAWSAAPVGHALSMLLENVVRAGILLAMYYFYEAETSADPAFSFSVFLSETPHQFIALATLILGLSHGLSGITAQRYLELLRDTSARLKTYSEWLLGRDLLGRAITDPTALSLSRQERSVVFMDIRGFTAWSEPNPPEEVIRLLNEYYEAAEGVLSEHRVVKLKFAADEVMAVFPSADDALAAAMALRAAVTPLLARENLGAGIGVHTGPLAEGLLGSGGVRFYDVIGDTVNAAKRIESAARAGELLISEETLKAIVGTKPHGALRPISVKGRSQPINVCAVDTNDAQRTGRARAIDTVQ